MTDNEKAIFDQAVNAFMVEPEALTQEQIAALRRADSWLGDRAVRKCHDALQKAAEARHRTAMGQPPAKVDRDDETAETIIDTIGLTLAPQKARIKALETQNATLEQRYRELETRVLELEAMRSGVPNVEP